MIGERIFMGIFYDGYEEFGSGDGMGGMSVVRNIWGGWCFYD